MRWCNDATTRIRRCGGGAHRPAADDGARRPPPLERLAIPLEGDSPFKLARSSRAGQAACLESRFISRMISSR
jgi:hypothetical protein